MLYDNINRIGKGADMAESQKSEQDNREIIESTAYRLFRKIGYKLTSYTMIAEESGIGRPLVQYYFPKKDDIATSFIFRVLGSIVDLVDSAGKSSQLPQGRLVQLGQMYYAFLLSSDEMKRLTLDLFSSRQVTSKVIEANATYTLPILNSADDDSTRLVEASVKATGGVYELMFRGLERELPLDPTDLALQNTAAFMAFSSDMGYEEAANLLKLELLDEGTVDSMMPELAKAIFG